MKRAENIENNDITPVSVLAQGDHPWKRFWHDIRLSFLFGIKGFIYPGRAHALPHQLRGAILGIGLSIVPLLVVIVIANGMIDGITRRLIEMNTYHVQVSTYGRTSTRSLDEIRDAIIRVPGVKHAFIERDGFAQLRFGETLSGATIRSIPHDLFEKDDGFDKYFSVLDGEKNLTFLPRSIGKNALDQLVATRFSSGSASAIKRVFSGDRDAYRLRDDIAPADRDEVMAAFQNAGVGTILLGKSLSEKLGARPGDLVHILSMTELGSRMVPKAVRVVVTGVFSTGYQYIDKYLAYVSFETGANILSRKNAKEIIGIKVNTPYGDLRPIVSGIDAVLDEKYMLGSVETWYQLQINQYRSLQLTKALLVFIMVLIIIVAAANVYSSIVMIIMDRTQEIAILRSMGARRNAVTLSFLFTGFYAGTVGAFIGIASGLLVAVNINEVFTFVEWIINGTLSFVRVLSSPFVETGSARPFVILNPDFYLERIPIKISFIEVFLTGFLTICLSMISAYLPARIAGNIRPLEIIRKY